MTREEKLEYALLLMVYQYCQYREGVIYHEHMSAGETAFSILGLDDMDNAGKVWERIEALEKKM